MTTPESIERYVDKYLSLLDDEEAGAVLACSAAINLDDETAGRVIDLVVGSNGRTPELIWRVKNESCVYVRWDGTFRVDEDVRQALSERLARRVGEEALDRIHGVLAEEADRRRDAVAPNGALSTWRRRMHGFEASYQRILSRDETKIAEGGRALGTVWREAQADAKDAVVKAVEVLAPEVERRVPFERLPDETLFLRGMAARRRKDQGAARRYFEEVWRRGKKREQHEDVHAIASHLFGNLVKRRDSRMAEEAFRDSIAWNDDPYGKGQVYHSLGNLLARQRQRWTQAEDAYRKSLELLHDASDQGQVYHSLGNLLAQDDERFEDAEDAYRKSLELRHDASDQGQVYPFPGKPPRPGRRTL